VGCLHPIKTYFKTSSKTKQMKIITGCEEERTRKEQLASTKGNLGERGIFFLGDFPLFQTSRLRKIKCCGGLPDFAKS